VNETDVLSVGDVTPTYRSGRWTHISDA